MKAQNAVVVEDAGFWREKQNPVGRWSLRLMLFLMLKIKFLAVCGATANEERLDRSSA